MRDLTAMLAARRAQSLYRERLILDSPQGVEVNIDGELLISFCSNDYLGLANHPDVITAFRRGAEQYGVGSGASHFVTGHSRAHHMLEEELADFIRCERVLLFSTGYMANLGVLGALATREGCIYSDRLNHASLIDGTRLSRGEVKAYPHLDIQTLREWVEVDASPAPLIVTDAVFSMDGDLAPLPDLTALARESGAFLVADDAHGFGVLGAHGRGSFERWGVECKLPAVMVGTLGKALGTFGAFVAGDTILIDTLIQYARPYMYTTALPPAVAQATLASLRIVREESWRRTRVHALVRRFVEGAARLGLTLLPSETPIQPLMVGNANVALRVTQELRAAGFLIPAIRPPTVAPDSARLRLTFSSAHDETHVDRLLDAFSHVTALREAYVGA